MLIDKSKSTVKLIFTLGEINPSATTSTLNMVNQFDLKDYVFVLPVDSSLYPERYNEYIMDINVFSGCTAGRYKYNVTDDQDNIIQVGILTITDKIKTIDEEIADEYIQPNLTTASTSNDFIIYKKK